MTWAIGLVTVFACAAQADEALDQARRIHDRLVGVPPDPGVLTDMRQDILDGFPLEAANTAMLQPAFVNVVLKNWVKPWTNVDQTVFVDFNDYVATVIGIIRDGRDYREVLNGDTIYVGDIARPEVPNVEFSHFNNDHYVALEQNRVDLSNDELLVWRRQSDLATPDSPLASTDAAGVVTTRAAGEAFFSTGTNRRMFRFTAMNFMCRDMEQLKDVTRPADRVRQDVNRSPGGDSELFHSQCVGCHSGMDPLAGAYAYFEWDAGAGRVMHTPGLVQPKNLINDNTFPGGYVTTNNRWDNFWREGLNASLGWNGAATGGFGAQSLGSEIANSRAFSLCQVERVFEQVCFRPPRDETDTTAIETIADAFEADYNMKSVFGRVAVHCMGE